MALLTTGVGKHAAGPAGYQGPGDIVAFTAWRGLRAYSAAKAAALAPCIDIVENDGSNPLTVNLTAAGNLDVAAIAAWIAANSVFETYVTRIYDQVGNDHIDQAVLTNMPRMDLTAVGGTKPGVDFVVPRQLVCSSGTSSVTQPWFVSCVAKQTSAIFTAFVFGDSGLFFIGNNTVELSANAVGGINVAAVINSFHRLNGMANTTSSKFMVDGSDNSGTTTTGDIANNGKWAWGTNPNFATQEYIGIICEEGYGSGNPGDSVRAALDANQAAYWGL